MDESGRFPGEIKLASVGIKPNAFEEFGIEKSFISLFMMIPVSGTISWEPKKVLTVVVIEMAIASLSVVTICAVPGLLCINDQSITILRALKDSTYVGIISSPAGSYADTSNVWASDILDRISDAVDSLSILSSYSCMPGTKDGSPSSTRYA